MTYAELPLWFALKGERFRGLHFRRQQTIAGFIVDFYCHKLRLIIEVDGAAHNQTAEYDKKREQILANLGMTLLRFSNQQVIHNMRDVLKRTAQVTDDLNSRPR